MKKKPRGALHKKRRANAHPREARAYCRNFAVMRAEAMDGVLTPAEQAVWDRVHYRHD